MKCRSVWYIRPMRSHADPAEERPGARGKLLARKQEFVRDAIWTAAIDLFQKKGFDETTVEDIVEAAGTSRRTFFRYFESKRDLIAQPVATYGASITKAIESCPVSRSSPALFRHVVLEVARATVSDARMRQVMGVAAKYPAAREAQLSRVAEVQDRLAAAFRPRVHDDFGAHVLAGLTLSALSLTYRFWFSRGKKDIDSAVEQVFRELSRVIGEE